MSIITAQAKVQTPNVLLNARIAALSNPTVSTALFLALVTFICTSNALLASVVQRDDLDAAKAVAATGYRSAQAALRSAVRMVIK